MRRVLLAAPCAVAAVLVACTSLSPTASLDGKWTLTLTDFQLQPSGYCQDTMVVDLVLTRGSNHAFSGTYTAAGEGCTSQLSNFGIVGVEGTVDDGLAQNGQISFTLHSPGQQSAVDSLRGTQIGSAAAGTMLFQLPTVVVTSRWTLRKS